MIIFPAIDIKDGKYVMLIKGDFNKITSEIKKNNVKRDMIRNSLAGKGLFCRNGYTWVIK